MKRFIMAALAILVLVGAVLAATGVLSLHNTNNETGVTIDKKELKEKSQEAVKKTEEAGSRVLDKTGEELQKAADKVRGSAHEQKAPATAPRLDDQRQPQPDKGKWSSAHKGT